MPYFNDQKKHELAHLAGRIHGAIYQPFTDLTVTAWVTPEPVPFAERESGERKELRPGDKWGGLFDCAWFHFEGTVPAETAGKCVVLLIDVSGEACVVDGNGNPTLGLTTLGSEYDFSLGTPGKRVVPLLDAATGGEQVDVWADTGCNDLFGRLVNAGTLKEARIAVCRPEVRALAYDWEVLHELMTVLPEDSARRATIWQALCDASLLLRGLDESEAPKARAILAPELAKRGGDPSLVVSAIGHSHIDLAWLWPIRETIRKAARTFATTLDLMKRYPDYVFGASQPQLFQWMKDRYPSIYSQIEERVAQGRWEVQGAMWVESDTNVPCGESLVRQILYGKRFFRQEFGKEVKTLWLPDVFGYSGSLPQLLRKAGVEYFLTQKLSWSIVNRYPHHTFLWEGIDGTQVLAHLPPEDTYNSSAAPRAIAKAERNFADKGVSDRCLVLFGIGDGGGGPGEEHLERLAREKDLAGICPVVQEPSDRFFERIEEDRGKLQSWRGELYLERHQGTFTTQARNKRYNRRMELALREAEIACVRAHFAVGHPYPSADFDAIWKEMLLYQFHDILPGSSIARVYTESLERYATLLEQTEQLTRDAETAFYTHVEPGDIGPPVAVSNSLSWKRSGYVRTGDGWRHVTVDPLDYTVSGHRPLEVPEPLSASCGFLENDLVSVGLGANGALTSVVLKATGREVLEPSAQGNVLAVYDDPGDAWDFAMDYDRHTHDRFALQSSAARIDGPEAILTQMYAYGASTLTQEIVLTAGSACVVFRTHVDWRESNKMLRTSFPVSIHADEATCGIQFGSIKRPMHRNTSWDLGMFEVCAQGWADVSDRGFGVALLSDCKYGYKLRGNVLDLNLLRSPGSPDPVADRAEHDFTYSLYPHAGDHVEGHVARAALELAVPLRVLPVSLRGGVDSPTGSLASVDCPGVIVDTAKKAEDSDDLILRLYEIDGRLCEAHLAVAGNVKAVELVDLMEENPRPLAVSDGRVALAFRPFEVHTVKVAFA